MAITKALRDNYSVTAVYDLRGAGGINDEALRYVACVCHHRSAKKMAPEMALLFSTAAVYDSVFSMVAGHCVRLYV